MVGLTGTATPDGIVRFAHPVITKLLGLKEVGLLSRTGEYACTQPRGGYHGGASLEECVVPCAVIVRDGVAPAKPAWWTGDIATATPSPPFAAATVAPDNHLVIKVAGRSCKVPMPTGLSPREIAALQAMSQQHDARLDTTQLAGLLGTRASRVDGMMAELIQKLADQGKPWLRSTPGPNGTIYDLITDHITSSG